MKKVVGEPQFRDGAKLMVELSRAETRIPQPKAVRVADALAGVSRGGEVEGKEGDSASQRLCARVGRFQPQSRRAGSACNVTSWTDRQFSGRRTSGA